MLGTKRDVDIRIIAEQFWAVIFIEMLSYLSSCTGDFINSLIIGNCISSAALAGLGLCAPLGKIMAATALMIAGGAKVVSGYYIGRGNEEKVKQTLAGAVSSAAVIGVIFTLVMLLFPVQLADLLGATDETRDFVAQYIPAVSWACVPLFVNPTLGSFLIINNRSKITLIGTLIQAVSILCCGYLAVKIIGMGMRGVGYATSAAYIICFIFLAVEYFKNDSAIPFDIKNVQLPMIGRIMSSGLAFFIMTTLGAVRNFIINKMLVQYGGTAGVAAFSITGNVVMFQDAVLVGGVTILSTHMSVAAGEGDSEQFKKIFKYEATYLIAMMIAVGAIVTVCGKPLARLFGAGDEIAGLVQLFAGEYQSGEIFFAVLYFVVACYQCLGYAKLSSVVSVLMSFVYPVIWLFILPKFIGVYGVCGSFQFQGIFCLITPLVIACIFRKHLPKNWDDWLLIKEHKLYKNKMNISVDNLEDVVKVSESISDFLRANAVDARRANLSGLCMEEMAANIVKHGFTKAKNKACAIDIFVGVGEEDIDIRLRDNASKFNPVKRIEKYKEDPDNPTKNFGIRMVYNIAKEMNYQSTFGKNVLLIKM